MKPVKIQLVESVLIMLVKLDKLVQGFRVWNLHQEPEYHHYCYTFVSVMRFDNVHDCAKVTRHQAIDYSCVRMY